MRNLLSVGFVFTLCFFQFPPASAAQSTQPVFGGLAEITLPQDALLQEVGFRRGFFYDILLGSNLASVRSERLPAKKQKWTDARWLRSELSYYRNKKYKRQYRFRNLETSAEGNVFSVEVQFTLKQGGRRTILRMQERKIRVDKATVITAFYVTDKPGSWNNEESTALRATVMSLRAAD